MTLSISTVRPDWEDIVAQLQSVVGETPGPWLDFLTSSTGQTVTELIATIGALDQYTIESSFQETYPSSAKNVSSIYAAAQMLGVRLSRKKPMEVTVSLSGPAQVIPAYSIFSGSGSFFFNRSAITVTPSPSTVTLYQGKVQSAVINGLGLDFQAYVAQEGGFLISDSDILVSLNGIPQPLLPFGLWQAKGTAGVQDVTLPDGRMALIFGSNYYGTKPKGSDLVYLLYAVTSGTGASVLTTNGAPFVYNNDTSVSIVGTSAMSGGGDENPASVYKSIASPLFGTFGSAVTKAQYIAMIYQYPGSTVIDALTYAQREINTKSLKWMNLIRAVLLTSSPLSPTQQADFISWFQQQTMYSGRIFLATPSAYNVTVTISAYCANTAVLSQVTADVTSAINRLFALKAGVLGRDIFKSDIIEAAMASNKNIEYVILASPSTDIFLGRNAIATPSYSITPSGGSLAIGVYDYAIGYINSLTGLEVAPTNWVSASVVANSSQVVLNWTAVPNVTSYKVWGRSAGAYALIATVASGTVTFTDTGSITPTGTLLDDDTHPTLYAHLNALTVTPAFSGRAAARG